MIWTANNNMLDFSVGNNNNCNNYNNGSINQSINQAEFFRVA